MTSKFEEWLDNCTVKYTITPEGLYEFDVIEPPPIIPAVKTKEATAKPSKIFLIIFNSLL